MGEARRHATTTPVMARAATKDAGAIAELLRSVAETLTARHGKGHWSHMPSENGVRRNIDTSIVVVARCGRSLVGTFRLATKKPWAVDASYFVAVKRPLYLLDMAVEPKAQGRGIGRAMVEEARCVARGYPAGSIRLDAYDSAAGAGAFYLRCGFSEVGRVVYRGTPLIYFEWLAETSSGL